MSRSGNNSPLVWIFIVLIFGGIIIASFFWPYGFAIWLLLVAIGLIFLVRRHARDNIYECPKCHHQFAISSVTDFLSPHHPNRKFLKCPNCGVRSMCDEKELSE
jgi:DNA-directed RNA polymerase subunit RPC12/RpoP